MDKKRKVKVMVVGAAGTGKTAIGQLLVDTLTAAGIDANYKDPDDLEPRTPEQVINALMSLGDRIEVDVEEKNIIPEHWVRDEPTPKSVTEKMHALNAWAKEYFDDTGL